jgi:small subunit ribosomal protein S2
MAVVTMRQLLEAGVHFGHQTRRWNPKMKRFIFGERNGIYIIDLRQTLERIDVAYSYVRDLVAGNGTILFVGTKKQTQDPIARYAQQCGMPYINERWLGGMLTNYATIAGRVAKMQEYERMRAAGDFDAMPKKEALILSRELEKLQRNLGGIRNMSRLPDAVFIIDTKKEHIAVTEANKLGLPIVAVVDTNCDPDLIQYVIPGNDDAIRAGTLMCRVIADAVEEGRFIASRRAARSATPAAEGPRPRSPEEEAEREEQQRQARRQAALAQAEREARLAQAKARAGQGGSASDLAGGEAGPAGDGAGPAGGEAGPAGDGAGPAGGEAGPAGDGAGPAPESSLVADPEPSVATAAEPAAVVDPVPAAADPEPVAVDPVPAVVDPVPVAVDPEPVAADPDPAG